MGFRCTIAGDRAGVDGVEKAADTLPLAANGGDAAPFAEGGSGMLLRDGGVSGAPNDNPPGDPGFASSGGPPGDVASFATAATFRGEKGGVRGRASAAGSARGGTAADGAARGGAAVAEAAGGFDSARGSGGGHATADDAGVLPFEYGGLIPGGVEPCAAAFARAGGPCMSSTQFTAAPTGMRPPQTEQRARNETLVIFAGSRRKTE